MYNLKIKDYYKILIIGEKNSGKTSFIKSLCQKEEQLTEHKDPKAFRPIIITEYYQIDTGKYKVKVNIQEVNNIPMENKTPSQEFLFENVPCIIICIDQSNSDFHHVAKKQADLSKLQNRQNPILVALLTHKDSCDIENDKKKQAEFQRLATLLNLNFYSVSNKQCNSRVMQSIMELIYKKQNKNFKKEKIPNLIISKNLD